MAVHSLRLGTHPRPWKVARGVPIPKPNRQSYGLAKNYRTISLLNCLDKVVERVVTELLRRHCENDTIQQFTRGSSEREEGGLRWTR